MTNQEIFDHVAKYALLKNKECHWVKHKYEYRANIYVCDLVACLIPRKDRHILEDDYPVEDHEDIFGPYLSEPNGMGLLKDIQIIHDNYSPNKWRYLFHQLAEKYNLDDEIMKYLKKKRKFRYPKGIMFDGPEEYDEHEPFKRPPRLIQKLPPPKKVQDTSDQTPTQIP